MAATISLLLLVLFSTTFLSTCLAGEGENDTVICDSAMRESSSEIMLLEASSANQQEAMTSEFYIPETLMPESIMTTKTCLPISAATPSDVIATILLVTDLSVIDFSMFAMTTPSDVIATPSLADSSVISSLVSPTVTSESTSLSAIIDFSMFAMTTPSDVIATPSLADSSVISSLVSPTVTSESTSLSAIIDFSMFAMTTPSDVIATPSLADSSVISSLVSPTVTIESTSLSAIVDFSMFAMTTPSDVIATPSLADSSVISSLVSPTVTSESTSLSAIIDFSMFAMTTPSDVIATPSLADSSVIASLVSLTVTSSLSPIIDSYMITTVVATTFNTRTTSSMIVTSSSLKTSLSTNSATSTSIMPSDTTTGITMTSIASSSPIPTTVSSSVNSGLTSSPLTTTVIIDSTATRVQSSSRPIVTTTTTVEPSITVQLQLRIPETTIPANTDEQNKIAGEIRNQIAFRLNIRSVRVFRIVLSLIDENNMRTVVGTVAFPMRRKRQSDTVNFNAIEVDIQSEGQAEANELQGAINQLSNQNNTNITINDEVVSVLSIMEIEPQTSSSSTLLPTISGTEPTDGGDGGLSNSAVTGIILGILLGVLLVALIITAIVLVVINRRLKSKSYDLDNLEMSTVKKYDAESKMPPE